MRLVVVEKPEPFVTIDEAKRAARIDPGNNDDNDLLASFIAAACQHIDNPEKWFGRAVGPQVWEVRLDRFGCEPVRLPGREILQVIEVGYIEPNGAAQIAAADLYELRGDELGSAWGKSWPAFRRQSEAVRIKYRAGYGKLEGGEWIADVPAPIKTAVLMHVAHLYANREAVAGETMLPVPLGYHDMLEDYRAWL